MEIQALQKDIISYSRSIGIDQIGFALAEPFHELKNRLIRQQELNYASGFEEPDLEKRTNPKKLMEDAASIISIAVAYPNKMPDPLRSKKGERRGIFCRSSWGLDYHRVVKERLVKLEEYIRERIPEARLKSMVDTGELVDRAVAERAGVGWSGKNCSIISTEFGSYIYLGEMITNIPFTPDQPIEDLCGSCTKCLDACPTGALVQGGQIDAKRCISYLTQTKDFIPKEYREKLGNRLYGCDSCQTACPYNRKLDFHLHEECEPERELAKPLLEPLLSLSNRQFKQQFGHVSGAWRGKMPIQRNAILALGHFKDETSIPVLGDCLLNDSRPIIRGTAAWALGKIGGEEAAKWLMKGMESENNPEALGEMKEAFERIEK